MEYASENYNTGESYGDSCYSRASEWYLTFCFIFLLLEGVFYKLVDDMTANRTYVINRLTPYNLWPSVMYFFGVGLVIGFILYIACRKPWHAPICGRLAFLLVWIVFLVWGGYGALLDNINWQQDIRFFILPSLVVPWVVVIGQNIRYEVILSRLIKIGLPFALINIVLGLVFFIRGGHNDEHDILSVSWQGEYLLILPYLVCFSRTITVGIKSTLPMIILGLGIVASLHKPAMGTFLVANILIILIAIRSGRRQGSVKLGKTIIILFVLAIVGFGFTKFISSVGQGAAEKYLRRVVLKEGIRGGDVTGGRFDMWQYCLNRWIQHPVTGTGLGDRFIGEKDGRPVALPIHNLAVQMLMQTGVCGFLVLLGAVLSWVYRVLSALKQEYDSTRFWTRLGLISWIFAILISTLYGDALAPSPISFMFWLVLGLETASHSQLIYSQQFGPQDGVSEPAM